MTNSQWKFVASQLVLVEDDLWMEFFVEYLLQSLTSLEFWDLNMDVVPKYMSDLSWNDIAHSVYKKTFDFI